MTYIGTRDLPHSSNKGEIWQKMEDGKYKCINNHEKKELYLSEWQIQSDVKNGFLKLLKKDGTPGTSNIL